MTHRASNRLAGLEWWRGLLAIYILIHHAYFWIGVNSSSWFVHTLLLQGRGALVWMFVLSGWVAGMKPTSRRGGKRIKRLFELFVFAIAWGWMIEQLAGVLGLVGVVSPHPLTQIDELTSIARSGLADRMATFFQPRWPVFSLNHPAWTLRYDLLIAASLPWLLTRHKTKLWAVVILVSFALPWLLDGVSVVREALIFGSCWILGNTFAKQRQLTVLGVSLSAVAIVNLHLSWPIVWRDFLWASASLPILSLASHTQLAGKARAWGLMLGTLSLPIYLTHYPVLMLLRLFHDTFK